MKELAEIRCNYSLNLNDKMQLLPMAEVVFVYVEPSYINVNGTIAKDVITSDVRFQFTPDKLDEVIQSLNTIEQSLKKFQIMSEEIIEKMSETETKD